MKKLTILFLAVALLGLTGMSFAASTANQNVTIVVNEVNGVSISPGGAVSITISDVTGGAAYASNTDATQTLRWSTNAAVNKKITAALDGPYETGISLYATVTGGNGQQLLSTSNADVVTGLTKTSGTGVITYEARATMASAPNDPGGELQTITYTITNE